MRRLLIGGAIAVGILSAVVPPAIALSSTSAARAVQSAVERRSASDRATLVDCQRITRKSYDCTFNLSHYSGSLCEASATVTQHSYGTRVRLHLC